MIGCLCIHGFTGAPYEVEPLADYLKKNTNWLIETPTLPGHGEQLQLEGITHQEWLAFAEDRLATLIDKCETVYIIGFSMGGLIASYLAAKYPIEKLVLLSAAAYYVNPKQLLLDVKEMLKDGLRGKLIENELFLRYKKKIANTPYTATKEFQQLVKEIKPILQNITVPTLIVQGECDGIVPVKSAHYLFKKINSVEKELFFLSLAKHHVCHGDDKEILFNKVGRFLNCTRL